MTLTANWSYPTAIRFGAGRITKLAEACDTLGLNTPLLITDSGLARYRDGGHDGVIAFGGGSALDLAKIIAFMSGQTRPVWDFEDIDDWWTRADPDGIAPVIAVLTTAGTGSEVGRARRSMKRLSKRLWRYEFPHPARRPRPY